MFAVVASLSVIGNCLLCCLLFSHQAMLKKTYNVLILNLAITDVLGGKMLQTILFSILASLTCLVNVSLCLVLLQSQTMLEKTYNILVFNLTVSDLLQGKGFFS